MRPPRKLLWSLLPLLVQVRELQRALEQALVLVPLWAVVRALEPERVQQLVLVLVQRLRHRNQEQRLQVSSWHRASTSRFRSSTLHHLHCANCEFLERLLQKQMLLLRPMRQFC